MDNLKRYWYNFSIILQGCLLYLGIRGWLDNEFSDPMVYHSLFLATAGLAFFSWILVWNRYRKLLDTPLSQLRSASQGYVMLKGTGMPLAGRPLLDPLRKQPCLWYHYFTREKSRVPPTDLLGIAERLARFKPRITDRDESDRSFIMGDGSEQCVINPKGAEFMVEKKVWSDGGKTHTLIRLQEGQTIYAMGQFLTCHAGDMKSGMETEVREALVALKANPEEMRRRFDSDRDGEVSIKEWEIAREEIRREITERHKSGQSTRPESTLSKPMDGRPLIVSDQPLEKTGKRFRLLAWFEIAVFLLAMGLFSAKL